MKILVVAEKPSVAEHIAQVLGVSEAKPGYFSSDKYLISWALGHLVGLCEPGEIEPAWKPWQLSQLPMIPRRWPLKILPKKKSQYMVLQKLLDRNDLEYIVCATDAGREGELIFRYIYQHSRCQAPAQRLWLNTLTPAAVKQGFDSLSPSARFDDLANSARARAQADWLVGMNFSRAVSLLFGEEASVGRVQTPTLGLIVTREQEIRRFEPEEYFELWADFSLDSGPSLRGCWQGSDPTSKQRLSQEDEAAAIRARCLQGELSWRDFQSEKKLSLPPLLLDLNELSRQACLEYGLTAAQTLDIAQKLYEKCRLISYPRTDSRYLSSALKPSLSALAQHVARQLDLDPEHERYRQPIAQRYVNDDKVSDHHAIIPTLEYPGALSEAERQVYQLICNSFIRLFWSAYRYQTGEALVEVLSPQHADYFQVEWVQTLDPGWTRLVAAPRNELGPQIVTKSPGGSEKLALDTLKVVNKLEEGPQPYDDASLLEAMQKAGSLESEGETIEVGLGTSATRAQTIEALLSRGYLRREGLHLRAQTKGERLLASLPHSLADVELTCSWERKLKVIEEGNYSPVVFMREVRRFCEELLLELLAPPRYQGQPQEPVYSELPLPPDPPTDPQTLSLDDLDWVCHDLLAVEEVGEDVRRSVRLLWEGEDCIYQGFDSFRAFTAYCAAGLLQAEITVIICPDASLCETRTQYLRRLGHRAERLHSGRDEVFSQEVCRRYEEGRLDFLFLTPDQLQRPGMIERLQQVHPGLLAVESAEKLSTWSHHFQPDYLALSKLLDALRPAPILLVYGPCDRGVLEDVAEELELAEPQRIQMPLQGEGLALEWVPAEGHQRERAVHELALQSDNLPMVIYLAHEQMAERIHAALNYSSRVCRATSQQSIYQQQDAIEAYNRGQASILLTNLGRLPGLKAERTTTVLHTALPPSLPLYLQQILSVGGNAGGELRCLALHCPADHHRFEFWLQQINPEVSLLEDVIMQCESGTSTRQGLAELCGLDARTFSAVLEILLASRALLEREGKLHQGREGWQTIAKSFREHQEKLRRDVLSFFEAHRCRYQSLAQALELAPSEETCGLCDICDPDGCKLQVWRRPDAEEFKVLEQLRDSLEYQEAPSIAQIFRTLQCEELSTRDALQPYIRAMVNAGLAEVWIDSLEKKGFTQNYQRMQLTPEGRRPGCLKQVRMPAVTQVD